LIKILEEHKEKALLDVFIEDESKVKFWKGKLTGPPDTPYSDGNFEISIEFPDE
jgi:ubiquitin-protein ligase